MCGATHSWPHSPSSLSLPLFFSVFSPGLGPTNVPIPFPRPEERGKKEERDRREGDAEGLSEATDFFFLFTLFNGDSWNRPLRAGPHRVWAMFQLGIPTVARRRRRYGSFL